MFSGFQSNAFQNNAFQIVTGGIVYGGGADESFPDWKVRAVLEDRERKRLEEIEAKQEKTEQKIDKVEAKRRDLLSDAKLQIELIGLFEESERLRIEQERIYALALIELRRLQIEEEDLIILYSLPF